MQRNTDGRDGTMKLPWYLALAATTLASDLPAQQLTLDLRGAIAMPTADLADADLSTGAGFGATLAVQLQPHLHLYGGWDWMRFTADESFAGPEPDFEETGYTFGLRFEHPLGASSRTMYRLEAGGTYKHFEFEDEDGDITVDTGHGLGYEAGVGLLLPLSGSWRLAPTVRYRALSRDFTVGSITTTGDLKYVALEIGFSKRF
jgi:hypothetical protein